MFAITINVIAIAVNVYAALGGSSLPPYIHWVVVAVCSVTLFLSIGHKLLQEL